MKKKISLKEAIAISAIKKYTKKKISLKESIKSISIAKNANFGNVKTSDIKRLIKDSFKATLVAVPRLKARLNRQLASGKKEQAKKTIKQIHKEAFKRNKILAIATTGYTSSQRSKLKAILKEKGFTAFRKQASRFKSSNKANLVQSILKSASGRTFAEKQLKQTIAKNEGIKTKKAARALAKAYLNKLKAREYEARTKQAQEGIRASRQFMKEKLNALINAGNFPKVTEAIRHGIGIETYLDRYWQEEFEQRKRQAEQDFKDKKINSIPDDATIWNNIWLDLTKGLIGHVKRLDQGAQWGYWDFDNEEVISPV